MTASTESVSPFSIGEGNSLMLIEDTMLQYIVMQMALEKFINAFAPFQNLALTTHPPTTPVDTCSLSWMFNSCFICVQSYVQLQESLGRCQTRT